MAAAKPFLKWVGGKRQLLTELRAFVPARFDRYIEPFVGGGALFFDLVPEKSVLSDVNAEVIDCYTAVRDHVEDLLVALKEHHYEAGHYYAVRDTDPGSMSLVDRAARMIFLNRTGFNGLYRVNRAGKFNVPFGRYTRPRICNEENLRACSAALANAELRVQDFAVACEQAARGDFVYLDPPYVPVSRTAAFTAYARGGFGPDEQRRLSAVFGQLSERGVAVVLSNSDVPEVRRLYAGFSIKKVRALRAINSDGAARGRISEVLVSARGAGSTSASPARAARRTSCDARRAQTADMKFIRSAPADRRSRRDARVALSRRRRART
jgi:DNA adenine methylase